MCLVYDEKLTNKVKKSLKKNFTYYKIFHIEEENIYSPYYRFNNWGDINDNRVLPIIADRITKK